MNLDFDYAGPFTPGLASDPPVSVSPATSMIKVDSGPKRDLLFSTETDANTGSIGFNFDYRPSKSYYSHAWHSFWCDGHRLPTANTRNLVASSQVDNREDASQTQVDLNFNYNNKGSSGDPLLETANVKITGDGCENLLYKYAPDSGQLMGMSLSRICP